MSYSLFRSASTREYNMHVINLCYVLLFRLGTATSKELRPLTLDLNALPIGDRGPFTYIKCDRLYAFAFVRA